jgi:hypothetical protein
VDQAEKEGGLDTDVVDGQHRSGLSCSEASRLRSWALRSIID